MPSRPLPPVVTSDSDGFSYIQVEFYTIFCAEACNQFLYFMPSSRQSTLLTLRYYLSAVRLSEVVDYQQQHVINK